MSEESQLRERITIFARSIYTYGSSGNISARLGDGRLLVTRTGSSFGFVDPNDLALIDSDGHHLSGHKPTKEMPLHSVLPPPIVQPNRRGGASGQPPRSCPVGDARSRPQQHAASNHIVWSDAARQGEAPAVLSARRSGDGRSSPRPCASMLCACAG